LFVYAPRIFAYILISQECIFVAWSRVSALEISAGHSFV